MKVMILSEGFDFYQADLSDGEIKAASEYNCICLRFIDGNFEVYEDFQWMVLNEFPLEWIAEYQKEMEIANDPNK